MAGYAGLGRVTDPATQAVLKALFDLVGQLQRRLTALEGASLQGETTVDVRGQRLTHVGAPTALDDAATVGFVRSQIDGLKGVSGTVDTATAQVLTVRNGIIVEITP